MTPPNHYQNEPYKELKLNSPRKQLKIVTNGQDSLTHIQFKEFVIQIGTES